MIDLAIKNYHSGKQTMKNKITRILAIAAVFAGLGLLIVAADQVGHYLQTHRDGYIGSTR